MLENKIFVYGTLMNSFSNYDKYLKGKVTSINTAYIYGNLYHLTCHNCPGVIDGKDKVYGQVISFIDDEENTVLNTIDEFEKYFDGNSEIIYERVPKMVHYSGESCEMLSYYKLVNLDILNKENTVYIESGNWENYMNSNEIIPEIY